MFDKISTAFGATALLAACTMLAACTTTGSSYAMSEEVAAKLAKFEKTGEVTDCLSLRSIDQIKPLDDRNFLIETGVNDYYLAELSTSCTGADRSFNRLQYKTSLSSLCRNEIITVVDNSTGFTVGSCGMSDFQELEMVDAAAS